VQGFSVIGAYIFGHMVDRRSSKQSLIVSLLLMIVAVIWLMFSFSIVGFYLIGALAGFALTGVQSVSRTMVSQLSPPGQSAEFYGLFAVTGRTSSFIGPTVYGVLAAEAAIWFTNRGETVAAAEQLGQRVAIGSILVFLLIGLGVLLSVNEARGRAAALEAGE
ncbi:MAG: MFS transporter, partial [Anaerolineae bacterium]